MNDTVGGFLAALGIVVVGFVIALGAMGSVRRLGGSVLAESLTGTTVRLIFSAIGVLGVFLTLGRNWGLSCALGTVPLYFIELTVSVFLLTKRISPKEKGQENRSRT